LCGEAINIFLRDGGEPGVDMALPVGGCRGDLPHKVDQPFLDSEDGGCDERFPNGSGKMSPGHSEGSVEFVNGSVAMDAAVCFWHAPPKKKRCAPLVSCFCSDRHALRKGGVVKKA